MVTPRQAIRPDVQNDRPESDLLRQEILFILGLAICTLGLATTILVRPDFSHKWGGQFLVFLSLLVTGVATVSSRRSFPRASAVFLIFGLTLCLVAALHYMKSGAVPFYAALIVLSGFLLSPRFGLATAILNTACLLVFRGHAGAPAAILFLWCVTGLAWLSLRLFHTALAWSQSSQQYAAQLLNQTRHHQGELNATLKMLREATDRLNRVNGELAVARQEAVEARTIKEQFVANVSHELRTPLNLVVGFAEMMYLDPDGYEGVEWSPDLVGDVGQLHRAAKQLQRLIDDILDLSRIDASRLPMFREIVPIEPIVRDAIETIAPLVRQHGLTCELECDPEIPDLYVDQTRIRQIMLNLLNNSVRYTEQGGIHVTIKSSQEAVLVSVQDTGVGIPEDQLHRLFDRFQQAEAGLRSAGGAGLGLALSRQFVELHGGRIEAQSVPTLGSTFTFSLPLPGTAVSSMPLRQLARRNREPQQDTPVIVVDPDPSVPLMLSRYLGDRRTLHARDMAEAEALVEAEHPIAVVVNCLPTEADEAWFRPLGQLSTTSSVPIVRCSIPSPSWLAGTSGFDGCLIKPVSTDSLRQNILGLNDFHAILVVDDDIGFVSLMQRMLRRLGYAGEVYSAYDGVTALRVAKERRPDLVLLDLMMPGKTGFEVVAAIRQVPDLEKTRVVAVTASSYATEALSHFGGRFAIYRPGGIPTGKVADLLHAMLGVIQPDYSSTWNT
jgi:signal transduction histidine kinase/CheY-like chemotaxis protein